MCDNCLQRKDTGADSYTMNCPSCVLHCARNDPRCLSRLVSYFADSGSDRLTALLEFTELVSSAALTPEEVMGTGCVKGLLPCFGAKAPQNVVTAAAYLLNYVIAMDAQALPQLLEDKLYVINLVASAEKYITEATYIVKILSKIALNTQGRTTLGNTHRIIPIVMRGIHTLDVALAGSCAELIVNIHAEANQLPLEDQENEHKLMPLIATFLSQMVAAGKLDVADTAVSAINALCTRKECVSAFFEAEGINALVNSLTSFSTAQFCDESKTEARIINSLNALFRLTRKTECCSKIMDSIDTIVSGCEHASEKSSEVCQKFINILYKLAINPVTRGRISTAIIEKYAAFFAMLFKTQYKATENHCISIIITILLNVKIGKSIINKPLLNYVIFIIFFRQSCTSV